MLRCVVCAGGGLLFTLMATANAAELMVTVRDGSDKPLANAVVFVPRETAQSAPAGSTAIVDQIDKEFIPQVRAVQVGTAVSFPNKDNIRHQVYSFSDAKVFEIPLYKGVPAEPIVFDKPGVVSLGCNIHDWMSGYVFVASSGEFAVTDNKGEARLMLAAGNYPVQVWHPTLKGDVSATQQTVQLLDGAPASLNFSLSTRAVWTAWRGTSGGGGGYR